MPKELSDSMRARLYGRSVSPLMRSILCFWAIWNYKFVLLVFSAGAITEKYRIIDEILYASWQQIYLQTTLYPVIAAIIYLYCYPYPAKFVFEFTRRKQIEIANIEKKVSNKSILTVKDSQAIRRDVQEMANAHQKDLETNNIEIRALKADRKSYKTELDQAISAAQPLEVKIKEQVKIIERLRREKNALARKEPSMPENPFKSNPFSKKPVEPMKQTEVKSSDGIVQNTWNMEETIDTEPVSDVKKTEPVKDAREDKALETEKEAKPAEEAKETNLVEDIIEAKSAEDERNDKPVEDITVTKVSETIEETKSTEDENETKLVQETKDKNPVENTKNTQRVGNAKEIKAVKSTKSAENIPVDDTEGLEDLENVEGIEGIEALGELMFKYSKD